MGLDHPPGLLVSDFYDLSLAQWRYRQDAVAISERADSYVGSAILGIPVMLGLLGLVLLLVALWRAGFAPAWVPTVFLLGSVASSFGPSSLLTFTLGIASCLATLGYVGLKILKISADEWKHGVPPVTGLAGARPRVQ